MVVVDLVSISFMTSAHYRWHRCHQQWCPDHLGLVRHSKPVSNSMPCTCFWCATCSPLVFKACGSVSLSFLSLKAPTLKWKGSGFAVISTGSVGTCTFTCTAQRNARPLMARMLVHADLHVASTPHKPVSACFYSDLLLALVVRTTFSHARHVATTTPDAMGQQ